MEHNLKSYIKNYDNLPLAKKNILNKEIDFLESNNYSDLFIKFSNISNSLKSRKVYFYFEKPFSYFSISYHLGIIEYNPSDFGIDFNHILNEDKKLNNSININISFNHYHQILEVLQKKTKRFT